jgi:hypothetical protein
VKLPMIQVDNKVDKDFVHNRSIDGRIHHIDACYLFFSLREGEEHSEDGLDIV